MAYSPIGIDLGTTNSVVAIIRPNENRPTIITSLGKRLLPSVAYYGDGERIIGDKQKMFKHPKSTFYGIKRIIGRDFDDKEIQPDLKSWPFTVEKSSNGRCELKYSINGEEHTLKPEEVSAAVLSELKESVRQFGVEAKEAVITVPAFFDDTQRKATIQAAEIAGLKVLRIINEPTAAALAYGTSNSFETQDKEQKLLVFDFGGGTFDVSILSIEEGVYEVLCSKGDTHLGGDDLDQALYNWLQKEWEKKYPDSPNPFTDQRYHYEVLNKCINIKHSLSIGVKETFEINIDHESYEIEVTRSQLESVIRFFVDKCIKIVKECLEQARLQPEDINKVLLVGGSTKIPLVREKVKRHFKKDPVIEDPDEIVALGASYAARNLSNFVEKNKTTLIDVTPHDLGVAVRGTDMSVIIKSQSNIPCSQEQEYSTSAPLQSVVKIEIFQGPNPKVKDNKKIAETEFSGWRPQFNPVQINIKFEINENSILVMSAKCPAHDGVETQLEVDMKEGKIGSELLEELKEKNKTFETNAAIEKKIDKIKDLYETLKTLDGVDDEIQEKYDDLLEKKKNRKIGENECEDMIKDFKQEVLKAKEKKIQQRYKILKQEDQEEIKDEYQQFMTKQKDGTLTEELCDVLIDEIEAKLSLANLGEDLFDNMND